MNEISILPKWADIFDSSHGEDIPPDLIGATIVRIGVPLEESEKLDGGGLAIEYTPANSREKKLILLAFSDCGMWTKPFKAA